MLASSGEVFHSSVPGKLSLVRAAAHCRSQGACLATTGQLYLAWRAGLDHCDPGWLADGSVRYPIGRPRAWCGGEEPGVHTLYHSADLTGVSDTSALFGAYCYRGNCGYLQLPSLRYRQWWISDALGLVRMLEMRL